MAPFQGQLSVLLQLWLLPLSSGRPSFISKLFLFSLQILRISRCALHPKPWALCVGYTARTGTSWVPVHTLTAVVTAVTWGQDGTWRDTGDTTETCQPHHAGNHTRICHRLMESVPGLSQTKLSLCLNHAPWFGLGWHFWEALGRRGIPWGPVIPADLPCPAVCWAQYIKDRTLWVNIENWDILRLTSQFRRCCWFLAVVGWGFFKDEM